MIKTDDHNNLYAKHIDIFSRTGWEKQYYLTVTVATCFTGKLTELAMKQYSLAL